MPLSMERWDGKVAVVTGASSGIGEAISRTLVAHGLKVVGLARRKHLLDSIASSLPNTTKGTFHPYTCDVSSESSITSAFAYAKTIGPISILINSAGIIKPGTGLTDGSTRIWKDIFDVNVLALCVATREAVRDMKENKVAGHVVHINSLSGHRVPGFGNNVYGASKFAVTALTETLRQELNGLGLKIKVTSISPGIVATSMMVQNKDAFSYIEKPLTAEDIADAVVYALSTPPHVQVHEVMLRPIEQKS